MNLGKTILCGTALSAIALAAVPAAAQVSIGGEEIVTTPDGIIAVVNSGGDIDANGSVVVDSAGTLTLGDDVDVTGTLPRLARSSLMAASPPAAPTSTPAVAC